jgi:hypothetical protein
VVAGVFFLEEIRLTETYLGVFLAPPPLPSKELNRLGGKFSQQVSIFEGHVKTCF